MDALLNAEDIFRKSWTCWTLLQGDFWEVSSSSWIVQMPSSRKAVKNAKSWSKRRHLPPQNPYVFLAAILLWHLFGF